MRLAGLTPPPIISSQKSDAAAEEQRGAAPSEVREIRVSIVRLRIDHCHDELEASSAQEVPIGQASGAESAAQPLGLPDSQSIPEETHYSEAHEGGDEDSVGLVEFSSRSLQARRGAAPQCLSQQERARCGYRPPKDHGAERMEGHRASKLPLGHGYYRSGQTTAGTGQTAQAPYPADVHIGCAGIHHQGSNHCAGHHDQADADGPGSEQDAPRTAGRASIDLGGHPCSPPLGSGGPRYSQSAGSYWKLLRADPADIE